MYPLYYRDGPEVLLGSKRKKTSQKTQRTLAGKMLDKKQKETRRNKEQTERKTQEKEERMILLD